MGRPFTLFVGRMADAVVIVNGHILLYRICEAKEILAIRVLWFAPDPAENMLDRQIAP